MKRWSSPIVLLPLTSVGYKESPLEPERQYAGWCMLYLLSGEIVLRVEGEMIRVTGGEFLLLPPGLRFHAVWFRDSIGYMGGFEEETMKDLSYTLLRSTSPVRFKVAVDDEPLVSEVFESMLRNKTNIMYMATAIDLLLNLLHLDVNEGRLCSRFLDEIFKGTPIPEGPSYYSDLLGVSAFVLNRMVKVETGRTTGEWIAIARIILAKRYLKDKSLSMSEVSEKVGFEDQSYFSRFFRKHEGITPSKYRNNMLKKS